MKSFVPVGHLSLVDSIDRAAEIILRSDLVPALSQEERHLLQSIPGRPFGRPGEPVLTVNLRRGRGGKPPPSPISEQSKDLIERETRRRKQQHTVGETLQQFLYAGWVPSDTVTKEGLLIETPKHVWGGDQWHEALKHNRIEFARNLVSVSGRPVIPRAALEAAFNPNDPADDPVDRGTPTKNKKTVTRERDEQIYDLFKTVSAANPKLKRGKIFDIMRKMRAGLFRDLRVPTKDKEITDQTISRIIRTQQRH